MVCVSLFLLILCNLCLQVELEVVQEFTKRSVIENHTIVFLPISCHTKLTITLYYASAG